MRSEWQPKTRRDVAASLILATALALTSLTARADEKASPAASEKTQSTDAAAPADTAPAKDAAQATPAPAKKKMKAAEGTVGHLRHDGSKLARAAVDAIEKDASIVARESLVLRISSGGGLVSLAGTAGTIYDREQAARDAEHVDGVRGIHPSITIKAPQKIDPAALEAAVKQAVKDAGAVGASFDAKANADGTVQLNGEVTDEWAAVDAVRKVAGVTAIGGYDARLPGHMPPKAEAQLTVVAMTPAQDAVIAGRVKEVLKSHGIETVSVAVERGIAKLSGRATGYRQAIAAMRAASSAQGVLGVDTSKLTLNARAYRVGEERDAAEIERDVRRSVYRAAAQEGGQRIGDLRVHVNGGTVLLSGRASSEDAAYHAVEAAASVSGVQQIVNALTYPRLTHGS